MSVAVEAGLYGILLPAVVCGMLMLVQGTVPAEWRTAWASVAMAIGYAAGHWALSGSGSLRPREAINWMPYFAITTGIVGLVAAAIGNRREARVGGAALLIALGLYLFGKFDPEKRIIGMAGFFVGGLVTFLVMDSASKSVAKRSLALGMLVLFILLCVTIGLSGSAKLAQLMGAATACVGAVFTVLLVLKQFRQDAALPVFAGFALMFGAILYAHVFTSMSAIIAFLLAASSLGLLVPRIRAIRDMAESGSGMRQVVAFLAPAVMVALIGACAAFVAFKQSPPMDYY